MLSKQGKKFKQLILKNKGKFFSVEFIKKDGSVRVLNGHVGIKERHMGHNPASHCPEYVTVVENLGADNYRHRNVNVNSIKRLAIGGRVYTN